MLLGSCNARVYRSFRNPLRRSVIHLPRYVTTDNLVRYAIF